MKPRVLRPGTAMLVREAVNDICPSLIVADIMISDFPLRFVGSKTYACEGP